MRKRLLSLMLAVAMVFSVFSGFTVTASAEDTGSLLAEPEYTITFMVDGEKHKEITLPAGAPITSDMIPKETDKFYLDGWAPEVPDTMPAENIETEARLAFKRLFMANGGTFTNYQGELTVYKNQPTVIVKGDRTPNSSNKIDQHVTLPEVTKEGYTFLGWWNYPYNSTKPKPAIKPDKTDDYVSFEKSGTAMIARWSANTYTIKFHANADDEGEGTMDDQSFVYDTSDTLSPNTFTRKNYTFVGWATTPDGDVVYDDEESVKNISVKDAEDDVVNLYAVWEKTKYTLTLVIGDEVYDEITLPVGDEIPKDDFPVETSKFYIEGWKPEIPDTMPAEDIEAHAKLSYKRIFKADGGEFTASEYQGKTEVTVKGKWTPLSETERVQYVAVPEVVREGYTFLGWWNHPYNPDYKYPAIDPGQTGDYVSYKKSGTAMIARWEQNKYTVTFHANNGNNETVVQNFVYDEAQNLTKNSFDGKKVTLNDGTVMTPTFMGWATELKDNEAETVVYTNEQEVRNLTAEHGGNIDLYAVWALDRISTQLNAAYKVEHHFQQLNGKYELDKAETQFPVVGELGAEITAAKHKINKTGYHLNDTLSKSVVVAMPTTVDGELVVTTLQVYYDRNSYDITVEQNAGGTVKIPESVLYGNDVAYSITANEGFDLVSAKMVCNGEETDLNANGSFTMPAGDVTIVVEFVRLTTSIEPAAAAYKVEHHFQQNGKYVLDDEETLFPVVGKLGAEITAAKHKINKTGYHLNDTLSKSVVVEMPTTDDGKLIVTTLKMYYDLNKYDIKVEQNKGGKVDVPRTALYGADVSYTITPNRGYRLVSAKMVCGNDETDLTSSDSFTMPAGDVTVVVEFEKIIFNIDIANHTGGKVVATVNGVETKEATIGDEVIFVVTPDEGWKLVTMNYQIKVDGSQIGGGNAASAQKITMPAGDVYVKPVFEKIIYNINVAESQYGTVIAKVNGTKATTATIGDIVTFEVAPKIGYKLNKLNYYFTLGAGGGMKGDDTLTMRASDLKITPKWDPITYSITFHANGGQGSMEVQNFVYDEAQNLTKNAFTKESTLVNNDTMTYTFMGWATAANGVVVCADEASVKNLTAVDNDNINLYAIWVPDQVSTLPAYGATYFVEHYVEGPNNSYQMVEKEILGGKIGDVVTADSTKHIKTGYHMNDEASTLNGTISFDMTAADPMASLLTLQVYYDLNEYTVTFHSNNDKNEITVQNFVYTEAQNLTKNAFTKEITLINGETMTHTFMGWATAADGAVVYADEASVINLTETNNGNIDLYAIWVPNQVSAMPAQGATYFVEHYVENRNNGYQLVEKEILGGKIGDVVTADSTKYIDSTHYLDSAASTLKGTISFDLSAAEPMDTLLTLKVYYALNPIKSNSGGGSTKYTVTVEDTDNGSVESSRTRVSKGTTVTITVDPEAGYEVDDIVVKTKAGKEVEVTDKGEGKFTFKMPAANVIVSVDFAEAAVSDDNVQAVEEYILLTIDSVIAWVFDEYVTNDVAPVLRNARTMLPARFVAEALGGVVTWDEAEQKVIIVNGEDTIEIYIGEPFAIVNGDPVELDSPAFIENDRTYLPVRFIAENLGATVTWNGATQEVTITPVKN